MNADIQNETMNDDEFETTTTMHKTTTTTANTNGTTSTSTTTTKDDSSSMTTKKKTVVVEIIQPNPDCPITYIRNTSVIDPIFDTDDTDTDDGSSSITATTTTTTKIIKSAQDINDTELNLYLGRSWLQRSKNRTIIVVIRYLFALCLVEYWEPYVYHMYNHYIPTSWKRYTIYQLWYWYRSIHIYCCSTTTGIHVHASPEYHALTTVMYLFRFLPITPIRMRFALHQLTSCQPKSYATFSTTSTTSICGGGGGGGRIEIIDTEYVPTTVLLDSSSITTTTTTSSDTLTIPPPTTTNETITPPDIQKNFCRVKGLYIHYNNNNSNHNINYRNNGTYQQHQPTEYTLFWLYGGAFLSGDIYGNLGPADTIGYHANQMDVFIVEYRLAPEYCFDDIVWDICLAYRYLYDLRTRRHQNPNHIVLFGCSSGAALCLRLMQYISELRQENEQKLQQQQQKQQEPTTTTTTTAIQPSYIKSLLHGSMMPSGAVLASPYMDYTADLDPRGSFVQYSCHDLIVTEAVQEVGLPFLNTHMGHSGNRTTNSPLVHTMKYLPPLCVVVSQHETVYDETIRLVNMARNAGVPVTVGIWKYMCHVFLFFNGFIPEGQQAMDFICEWYKSVTNEDNQMKNKK